MLPPLARMCDKRLRKTADEGGNQAPSPHSEDCRTLSSPADRRTSWGCQCLLLDVLQIIVQKHVLTNQTFDGKQLNDLVLGPDSKLVMLC